jgi:7-cyano-7-deazaguanine synthase
VNEDVPVPEGSYDAESMKATVVPNRNMIMLALAAGFAVAENAQFIATAVHAGDHAIYPDCRPDFIGKLEAAIKSGNEGFIDPNFEIRTPYLYKTKTEIAKRAGELDVPIDLTWSCYKGGAYHCGRCGTCVERLEAISQAGVEDKTIYMDSEFWKEAVGA